MFNVIVINSVLKDFNDFKLLEIEDYFVAIKFPNCILEISHINEWITQFIDPIERKSYGLGMLSKFNKIDLSYYWSNYLNHEFSFEEEKYKLGVEIIGKIIRENYLNILEGDFSFDKKYNIWLEAFTNS